MIILHAKINLSGDTNNPRINEKTTTIGIGETQQVEADKFMGKNNASAKFSSVLNTYKEGSNPFILGVSKLGGDVGEETPTFADKVPYFVGQGVTNLSSDTEVDGSYPFPYPFKIILRSNGGIGGFKIVFDDFNEEYCKKIEIDDEPVELTSPYLEYVFSGAIQNQVTIEIPSWSRAKRPMRIQGVYVDLYMDVPFYTIKSYNGNTKDRGNEVEPSFGIISNSGDMSFLDVDNDYRVFSKRRFVSDNCALQVYIENTNVAGKEQLIGDYTITEWDANANGLDIDLTFEENLTKWQSIEVNTPVCWLHDETLLDLYKKLLAITPDVYKRYSVNITIDGTTHTFNGFKCEDRILQEMATIQNYSYTATFSGSTLWEVWEQFAMSYCYYIAKDGHGNVILVDEV